MEEIKKMKIGDPLDRSTDHGPQNHKAHLDKLLEYCEIGVKEGATLVYGGKQVDRPGRTASGSHSQMFTQNPGDRWRRRNKHIIHLVPEYICLCLEAVGDSSIYRGLPA